MNVKSPRDLENATPALPIKIVRGKKEVSKKTIHLNQQGADSNGSPSKKHDANSKKLAQVEKVKTPKGKQADVSQNSTIYDTFSNLIRKDLHEKLNELARKRIDERHAVKTIIQFAEEGFLALLDTDGLTKAIERYEKSLLFGMEGSHYIPFRTEVRRDIQNRVRRILSDQKEAKHPISTKKAVLEIAIVNFLDKHS